MAPGNPYTAAKQAPAGLGLSQQSSLPESIPIETKQINTEKINVYQQ